MLVSLAQLCIVYVVKEIASFKMAWSVNGCGKKNACSSYRPTGRFRKNVKLQLILITGVYTRKTDARIFSK